MSFDAVETSTAGARPVEIFTFARGAQYWRYTSADRDKEVAAVNYTAVPIVRSSTSQGSELNRSALKLTVPRDFAIAELYRTGIPAGTITLRVQQFHEGDGEVVGVWGGRVLNVARIGEVAEIVCEPVYTSVRQVGLRRRYQKQCPHTLYRCGVSANDFKLTTTVSAVSGLNVTAAAFAGEADGWWEGGWLEHAGAGGELERYFIFGHTGSTLELMTQPRDLAVSDSVSVYPGCDHTLATCAAKFNNADNNGGFPDIPDKNPYGSDPIY